MDNDPMGNKRANAHSTGPNSPCKAQKMDWKQSAQASGSSPQRKSKIQSGFSKTSSSISIDNKMNNVAKLRQQFVEEIKDIELSLKESIKNLKLKISEANRKADIITEKLREANKLLCNQSEIIYNKEQENKVLREKVEELYEYQKLIFENMEDISNTLNVHENLSDKLRNEYDSIIVMQQNDNKMLEEELNKIIPDQKLLVKLNEINSRINEQEKNSIYNQNEIKELESRIKAIKINKDEQQKTLSALDTKINELETRNNVLKENANKEKNKILNEIEKLNHEVKNQTVKIAELDKTISELKLDLETRRNNSNEIVSRTKEIYNEINLLSKENEQLDKIRSNDDQENKITLQKLKEQLKLSEAELLSIKQKENQATNVLQKKISELHSKLKSYEGLESKFKQYEIEKKKEEDLIIQITKESENQKKECNDKIKLTDNKIHEIKTKISQAENKFSESEEKIKSLEKEIRELNEKLETNINKIKINAVKRSSTQSISQYHGLPDLFASEEKGNIEKQKNRKKLYTPTLADDDLEIDSLSLEEQLTHLTQTKTSQSESPEKAKRFFKHSTLTQSKIKKEGTPRGKGRAKKY